jgi:uncharacterized iron-regulated protein
MTETIPHPAGTWLDPATRKIVSHADILSRMSAQQVVLLGETHNRYDIHRWQLHVAAGLLALGKPISMGFEMFPRRVQPALDAYVSGSIDDDAFLEQSEWQTVWGFPPALYLPLFQFCRQFKVPMLALNCHRPLVTRVGKDGWDAIPVEERDGLTPAKPATPEAREYLFNLTGGRREGRDAQTPMDPTFDRFIRAQQTWDRAFACNIATAHAANPDAIVIGIIGRGHMEYGHGTPFQLADLGIDKVAVLLPEDGDYQPQYDKPIAAGLFRLDTNDVAPLESRVQRPVEQK